MHFHLNLKKILDYCFAAVFIGIFALYCSGRVGWFLMLSLLLSPVLSVLYALLLSRSIRVIPCVDTDTADLKSHITLTITVENRSYLPACPVRITIKDNEYLKADRSEAVLLAGSRAKTAEHILFEARHAGGSYIGTESADAIDFFHLVSIPVRLLPVQIGSGEIPPGRGISSYLSLLKTSLDAAGVIPPVERPDFGGLDYIYEFLSCFQSGESEESTPEASLIFNGSPGYEYREYRPGDPLKRINSKLSAKKDTLWVRLDEKQAVSSVLLILDPFTETLMDPDYGKDPERDAALREKEAALCSLTLRQCLGIASILLSHDFSVELAFFLCEEWHAEIINEESALPQLAQTLSRILFRNSVSDGSGFSIYDTIHSRIPAEKPEDEENDDRKPGQAGDEKEPGRLPPDEFLMKQSNILYCAPRITPALENACKGRSRGGELRFCLYQAQDGSWRQP